MFRKLNAERIPPTYGLGAVHVSGEPQATASGYVMIPITIEPAEGTNGARVYFNLMFKEGWLNGNETPETRGERFVYRRSVASSSRNLMGFLEAYEKVSEQFKETIGRVIDNGVQFTPDILYRALKHCEGAMIGYRLEQDREKMEDGTYIRTDRLSPVGFFVPEESRLRQIERTAETGKVRATWSSDVPF